MAGDDNSEKWKRDALREIQPSTSCSSFEVLDPHDPVISRLATHLFRKTNDYLQEEMISGQAHYMLLEDINRVTITKCAALKNLSENLAQKLEEYNLFYEQQIQPLLQQIDAIDAKVSQFEADVYRLDNYTKQLRMRFKDVEDK